MSPSVERHLQELDALGAALPAPEARLRGTDADVGGRAAAIAALAIYKGDPDVAALAREAIGGPQRGRLPRLLERAFG